MPAERRVEIAGEPVVLHADRALYWPRHRRLLIADLHLGKGEVFRRAGIGVPRGGTGEDLARLARLLGHFHAASLWILGDVLHGPAHDAGWSREWRQWRAAHGHVEVAALVGNHDRALADASLGLELLGPAVDAPPFALRHEPAAASLHVLCGHLHPRVRVPGLGGRRWPAFWLGQGATVLPAFSAFTGGARIAPGPRDRLAVCADGELALLPAAAVA